MQAQRHCEVNVLGYRIERVRRFDQHGYIAAQWYEVMGPESDHLLGSFAQRAEAERDYQVVVTEDFEVDEAATAALRSR